MSLWTGCPYSIHLRNLGRDLIGLPCWRLINTFILEKINPTLGNQNHSDAVGSSWVRLCSWTRLWRQVVYGTRVRVAQQKPGSHVVISDLNLGVAAFELPFRLQSWAEHSSSPSVMIYSLGRRSSSLLSIRLRMRERGWLPKVRSKRYYASSRKMPKYHFRQLWEKSKAYKKRAWLSIDGLVLRQII